MHEPPAISSEFRLVINCLNKRPSLREAVQNLPESFSWDRFISDCRSHGVLPLVRRSLADLGWAGVPDAVIRNIKDPESRSRMISFLFAAENVRVVSMLRDKGLPVVSFKGSLLAEHVYGGLDLRQFLDIDLLVPPECSFSARGILVEAGYRPIGEGADTEYLAQSGQQAFRHSETGITVDLHWKLAPFGIPFPFLESELWANLQDLPLLDSPIPTLSWNHMALFMAFHGSKERWRKLKWVCDFSALYTARPELDWESLRRQAARRHCSRILLVAACLCDAIGLPAPPALVTAGKHDAPVAGLVKSALAKLGEPGRAESEPSIFWDQMAATERFRDKAGYVAALLTTPTISDFETVRLPVRLRGLYYLIRPFRLAAKAAGMLYPGAGR